MQNCMKCFLTDRRTGISPASGIEEATLQHKDYSASGPQQSAGTTSKFPNTNTQKFNSRTSQHSTIAYYRCRVQSKGIVPHINT